jgi:peptidyl-dipeptidase A
MKRLAVAAPVVWLLTGTAASPQDPKRFIDEAENRLRTLDVEAIRAARVGSTYITDDTETLSAKAGERFINATVDLAKRSVRFDHLQLPDDVGRNINC